MKIAHISDLHLCRIFKRQNIRKTKNIIKYAVQNGFDHLVITGDISDNSAEIDFTILRNILKSFNLLDSKKVTITIGNHDIFGGIQTAQDIINFPSKCMKINYEEKVQNFISHFPELFENIITPIKNHIFPFAKVLGDFVLIGLNSNDTYSKLINPFASNGRIKEEQFEGLKLLFYDKRLINKRKILAVHHHFYKNNIEATSSENNIWNIIEGYTLKLRGKKKLLKLFKENNVELVLHGHSHELKEYIRKGIRFINAGSCIDNLSESSASIYFINLLKDRISVQLKTLPENFNYEAKLSSKYKLPTYLMKSA